LTRQQLAHAFGLRLANAMQEKGWQPMPSVLMKHFNQMHPGDPVTIYSARSWLMGEYMPRPQRLISLALCLGVPPHRLLYGQFYDTQTAREQTESMVLSDREHRLLQCLRRLSHQDLCRIESLTWRSMAEAHHAGHPLKRD
jgi:hypothetical protein